jgi:lipid II:glycine glycyltransferase (peptidoglycan interpeptide bridge formation enzyme)
MDQSSNCHFFQSDKWAQFQKALGKEVISRSGPGWQYTAVKEYGDGRIGRFFKRLYLPYGPSYMDLDSLRKALVDLDKLAAQQAVDYIRVEPVCTNPADQIADIPGYQKLAHAFQPTLTLITDLDKPFKEVLSNMSKSNRYRWNKAARYGLTFSLSNQASDLDEFVKMMSATSKRTNAMFRSKSYFKTLVQTLGPLGCAYIAYGYHKGQPVTGSLVVDDLKAKTRYYLFAGSFDEARKSDANPSLLIYLMEDAQKRGLTSFDFFGVSPLSEPNHRWAGLSLFKRSFGGSERSYAGTWEKPLKAWRYWLLTMARKLA